ncbi:hypothetical protein [Halobacteriovorax sp. HLS]|uniref:hypothetical protein n=1 Tax=Halobacteriovorax sp. HLS TaxID=2234000 RepID=UPI000FD95D94|nr:hypothetical protein [Halobacteriovorax sp. HLS]
MRHIKQYILTILLLISTAHGAPIVHAQKKFDHISVQKSISESAWKKILKNEIYVTSTVKSSKKHSQNYQKLDFIISGLHPKSCRFALRKLSHYESFSKHLGFIKESSYDDKAQRVNFQLSSKLLPFDMSLNFAIPRIKRPGRYPFIFDRGFLNGLKGEIIAIEYNNRCLFYSYAQWFGHDTGIPDTLFEFFSKALAGLSMENLFRISATY